MPTATPKAAGRRKGVGGNAKARTAEGLTLKQQRYREALLEGLTQREAAARAGLSERHASVLIRENPAFKEALEKGQAALAERGVVSRLDLMRELWRIGGADLRELLGPNNCVLEPDQWPDGIAHAVESIDVQQTFQGEGKNRVWTGQMVKLRLHSKVAAIGQLAKMIGANAPPKAPVGPDGKPVPEQRRVLIVPAKRSEEDMAGYGVTMVTVEDAVMVPLAEPGPAPVRSTSKALARLQKMKP